MILTKKKRHAVIAGLCLGLAMAFIPAPIAQPKAEAAIAVWDEKNIEQAIQTAIKTAAILDVQQKELLLQIINQRKIDINRLADIVQKYQQKEAQSQKILAGDANVIPGAILAPGQLSDVSMTEALIRARIGDLKDILNGRITVVDAAENERKRQETIDETYKAAALQELAAREKLKNNADKAKELSDWAKNSDSQLEVMQIQTDLMATQIGSMDAFGSLLGISAHKEMMHRKAEAAKWAEAYKLEQQKKADADAVIKQIQEQQSQ